METSSDCNGQVQLRIKWLVDCVREIPVARRGGRQARPAEDRQDGPALPAPTVTRTGRVTRWPVRFRKQ